MRIGKSIFALILCFCIIGATKDTSLIRRALFVSVLQNPQVLASENEMDKLITFSKKAGIKIFFVQVYRANQTWFPSKIADQTPYEQCKKLLGQEPLAVFIKKAHSQGIEVHAWLNLLSLSVNKDADILKKYGPEVLTRNTAIKKSLEDYKIDNQYFLEPGDPRVREDLVGIVRELVGTYKDLDGIQFDYIRYPDVKPRYGYTDINIERYKKTTGAARVDENDLRWKNWKRDQVTELLQILVRTSRAVHPGIHVSSTGCMPYSRAYYEAFQDWSTWLDRGLVEFVTMMNYSDDPAEFARLNDLMKYKVTDFKRVKIAVGAYKFVHSTQEHGFEEELRSCEATGATCAIFHYASLLDDPHLADLLTTP